MGVHGDEQNVDVERKLLELSAEIRKLLARPWWNKGAPRDQERRKNLDRLCTARDTRSQRRSRN